MGRTLLQGSILALAVAAGLVACTRDEASGGVETTPIVGGATSAPAVPPAPPPPPPSVSGPGTPCEHLDQISQFPSAFGGDMTDPAYLALKASGPAAIQCLLEEIASTDPMAVPHDMPGGASIVVGDFAFLLLTDFGYVDFMTALPPDVRAETQSRGVFAYFDWVGQPGQRALLQSRVRTQLDAREGATPIATAP